jgi:hypothetical protein
LKLRQEGFMADAGEAFRVSFKRWSLNRRVDGRVKPGQGDQQALLLEEKFFGSFFQKRTSCFLTPPPSAASG